MVPCASRKSKVWVRRVRWVLRVVQKMRASSSHRRRSSTSLQPWRTTDWSEQESTTGSAKGPDFDGNQKGGSPGGCRCSFTSSKRSVAAGIEEEALFAELKTRTQRSPWGTSGYVLMSRMDRVSWRFHSQPQAGFVVTMAMASFEGSTYAHGVGCLLRRGRRKERKMAAAVDRKERRMRAMVSRREGVVVLRRGRCSHDRQINRPRWGYCR